MLRKYFTVEQHLEQTPGQTIYILMTPEGKILNYHVGTPAPEGKWCLLGVWP